jgi:rhodanese-related sulfurtransferase
MLGYRNVKVFREGVPAWKKAGYLLLSEPSYLKELIGKDIPHVLIDLRTPEEARKGFIPGAVSIPENELDAAKNRFPADKSAPIILYSDSFSEKAYKTVKAWGYKETTVLLGGYGAWKQMGGQTPAGDLKSNISYVLKPRQGEISIDEFKTIVESRSTRAVIVDVRDVDETMSGMLEGAINIPVGQIRDRLAELPKDKEIITHCCTGIRAEMAYDVLKENGMKARFLNAVIQIDNDGRYEVTKK